ncbi:hypothetical protein ES705_27998 [subsurface metagenome]
MNDRRTVQEIVEERGKLLRDAKKAINAEKYDQEKVDKLLSEVDRLTKELKLVESEQQKMVMSLEGDKAPEMRIYGETKTLKSAPVGDLEQWISDIVKSAFGRGGVQNRDVLEGSGSGQYAVPAVLSNTLISYITERSLLGRLGVSNVAVSTDTTTYAQVSALPTADVIAEGAELTETDPTFTPRTLQTYSYRAGTIISQEFEEDSIANPQNVIEPIVQSIAQNIDSDFINGAAPLGLNAMTGTFLRLHLGENGAALTGYEELGALWQKARELNIDLSAFVMSPRTLKEYKLLETATEEVPKPNPFNDIPMVETNMVLNAETEGSSTNCTRVYAGDFKRGVLAGWRYGSANAMKFLLDRSTLAEFGKVRIYGYCRMGLAHPYGNGIFGYIKGVIPPSGAIT